MAKSLKPEMPPDFDPRTWERIIFKVSRFNAREVIRTLEINKVVIQDVQDRPGTENVEVVVRVPGDLVGDVMDVIQSFGLIGPIKREPPDEDEDEDQSE